MGCTGCEGLDASLDPSPRVDASPGMDVDVWHGLVAPAGTPKEVIDKLSAEIGKILTLPDIKEFLVNQGFDPFISTPDQMSALLKSDIIKYTKIIKTANIKLE